MFECNPKYTKPMKILDAWCGSTSEIHAQATSL